MKWAISASFVGLMAVSLIGGTLLLRSETLVDRETSSSLNVVDETVCAPGGMSLHIENTTKETWYVRRGQGALLGIRSVNAADELIRLPRIPEVPPGPGRTFMVIHPGESAETSIPIPGFSTEGTRVPEGWYVARIQVRLGDERNGDDIALDTNPFLLSDCEN